MMEVNRKGWTVCCMDITCMGLRGSAMEGGGGPRCSTSSQRMLTSWLAATVFYNPVGREETSRGRVVLSGV